MKGKISDGVRLHHIVEAIVEVDNYLQNCTLEQFISNSEKRFATIKQLEIIGEACNAITREFKSKHPEIPWKSIIGFRNISIHEYFGVSLQLSWQIVTNDLPVLKKQITQVLSSMDD